MSVNAVEKALWQIYLNPADAKRYGADARAYMSDFKLEDGERDALASFDVMAMINHGANPLLVMMAFQTIKGTHKLPEYLATVNEHFAGAPAAQR